MMTEKFENDFHRRYVGGQGEVEEREPVEVGKLVVRGRTYEEILDEYRWYVRDPNASLPEEILQSLRLLGKV